MARRSAVLLILAFLGLPLVAAVHAPAAEKGTLEIVTKSGVRPFSVELATAHGPAAKAIRYVLIGFVSVNRCVANSPAVSDFAIDPFPTTRHATGARRLSATRAFRSG